MGGNNYSHDDYAARTTFRATTGTPTFAYSDKVSKGEAHGVHKTLNPKGVKIRESRDSAVHPVAVPITICNDLTGSMQKVPFQLQEAEPKLMGMLLADRAAGKSYLGEGYPAIMIAGVDDYFAMGAEGALQVGQFESGIEIDDNLTNLWITGNGGGNFGESYDLFLYFLARHTAHDHWDKRRRKGHAFIICDEPLFAKVSAEAVREVIGDKLSEDIPITQIIKEAKKRYHLFCIIPNQTSHYHEESLRTGWKRLIGEENVLLLEDPTKICELITSTIAMCEGTATLDDLAADNIATGAVNKALLPLSRMSMASHEEEDALPPVPGKASGTTRL